MKCPKGATKHRHAEHGHPGDYKRSLRGHTWKKTDKGTVCELCGRKQKE